MYKIGDKVIHKQVGACYIKQVVDLEINRLSKQYYLLVPIIDTKACIYVSVDKNKQKNIRPVIKEAELKEAEIAVNASPLEWQEDPKKRIAAYSKSINSFEFEEVLLTIKCLAAQNLQKKLNSKDEQLLLMAQKLVFSEVAIILNLDYAVIAANPTLYIAL